jgi:hypothetical protein
LPDPTFRELHQDDFSHTLAGVADERSYAESAAALPPPPNDTASSIV